MKEIKMKKVNENSECQCFTCKNKNNPDLLEAYYRGALEAYEDSIELFREEFSNEKLEAKLSALFNKLQYEKGCVGVLLEEAVKQKKPS